MYLFSRSVLLLFDIHVRVPPNPHGFFQSFRNSRCYREKKQGTHSHRFQLGGSAFPHSQRLSDKRSGGQAHTGTANEESTVGKRRYTSNSPFQQQPPYNSHKPLASQPPLPFHPRPTREGTIPCQRRRSPAWFWPTGTSRSPPGR